MRSKTVPGVLGDAKGMRLGKQNRSMVVLRGASPSANSSGHSARPAARHLSYYPPPEPFASPSTGSSEVNASASSSVSASAFDSRQSGFFPAPPISTLSTFGADTHLLDRYLSHSPTSLTLRSLLALGGSPGSRPSSVHLLSSARFTATELPLRLARRVLAFRNLPFIVGSNPHIQKVAKLYAASFMKIASLRTVADQSANEEFTQELERMVEDHKENIPTLARGFLESKRYMSPSAISAFLDGAIHSRIGIRLIAEQHLALTASHTHGATSATSVGIIDTSLNAAELIQGCADFVHALCETSLGCAPELKLEGDVGSTFCGVASHLTYTMTELLKNSYRATAERYMRRGGEAVLGPMPSVKITVARSRKHLTMRIRDEGGGVPPAHFSKIFEYTFTTASSSSEEEEASTMAGLTMGAGVGGHPSEMQNISSSGVGGAADVLSQIGGAATGVGGGMGTLAGLGYGLPMSR